MGLWKVQSKSWRQAKIPTLRHSTEMGLGRRISEIHDSLAWLVSHAVATINWFRPGIDGKALYELRVGRKFRRPVAPWGQKVWWMSAKKHVSRISAESRWQEGIFLGILGGGVGASDYAIGTTDGVQPARPIEMVLEIDAWDTELLLAVEGFPWDRRLADPAARIRLLAPEVPPEHVLPPPVGEPAGSRSRRVYIRRDVEIRKYGCDDRARGAWPWHREPPLRGIQMRAGPGSSRKSLSTSQEKGRCALKRPSGDSVQGLMMGAAERTWRWRWYQGIPFVLVQHGGSRSSLEVRPEPSRRRDAEEQLGGDVVRARLQDPQGVVRTAEEARLQPREELEAAVDSICKLVKELGALHVADSDVGEIFLPGRSAKLGSAFSEPPGTVVDLRYGWDLASAAGRQECWKTLHAERPELVIGSPPSRRHSPWIKDEREARLQEIKHLNFCCAVCQWQTERGAHFLHEHPKGSSSWDLDSLKAVRELPGVVVVRCDQRLCGLVERWPLKEGNVNRRNRLVG